MKGECLSMHIPWYKKIWIWICIIVILIVLISIPFIINESYKAGEGYITMWGAEELLAFYGNLLAAVATIVSVIITILFTVNNQKKERKLAVKPFLQSESHPIFSPKEACAKQGNKTIYLTYPHDGTQGVSSSLSPPYILEKRNNPKKIELDLNNDAKLDKKTVEEFVKDNAIDLDSQYVIAFAKTSSLNLDPIELLKIMTESVIEFKKEYYILEYSLTNVGAGPAVSINFTINNTPCLPSFSLTVSERKSFIILLKSNLLNTSESTINFSFEYKDVISQGKYKQIENVTIYKENEDGTLNIRQKIEDLISEPVESDK